MNPMNHAALAEQYLRMRAELIEAHPDLVEDEQALADTLEGITDISETVTRYVRDALNDETLAEALATRIKQMNERKARLDDRAAKRRAIVLALMAAADMKKLTQPDFTASLRTAPPKVIITDEAALPDAFVKIVRTPNKLALKEALACGDVPGASLSNGSQTITILTR